MSKFQTTRWSLEQVQTVDGSAEALEQELADLRDALPPAPRAQAPP